LDEAAEAPLPEADRRRAERARVDPRWVSTVSVSAASAGHRVDLLDVLEREQRTGERGLDV
jgi:hypothetical protein